ncbi:MAG: hypothetical protein AAF810_01655 [Cyanobacteria bacterium P01_D01_bin.36]|mgnify:CR=1 FL=1
MSAPAQGQSTAKTIFLLASAVCWLAVGGAIIYLVPFAMDTFRPSETTGVWMETLGRGGYRPQLAITGGGVALVLAVVGNVIWYQTSGDELIRKR